MRYMSDLFNKYHYAFVNSLPLLITVTDINSEHYTIELDVKNMPNTLIFFLVLCNRINRFLAIHIIVTSKQQRKMVN